jgi:hypothetical protein
LTIFQLAFDSLPSLSEVVAVGTAAAAVPIRSITRLSTSDKFTFWGTSGAEGVESRLIGLAKMMSEIQRGQREDTEDWCWEVTSHGDVDPKEAVEATERPQALLGPSSNSLSSISRLVTSLYPATLLGMWAFFSSPVPAAAIEQSMK